MVNRYVIERKPYIFAGIQKAAHRASKNYYVNIKMYSKHIRVIIGFLKLSQSLSTL